MVTIKVLGSGCENCKRVEKMARQAAADLAVEAEVTKVTEYADIMKYGILSTPGLVVNEKVVCSGRIPTAVEIKSWIGAAKLAW
jgi:small redox-active disulfide protein 2